QDERRRSQEPVNRATTAIAGGQRRLRDALPHLERALTAVTTVVVRGHYASLQQKGRLFRAQSAQRPLSRRRCIGEHSTRSRWLLGGRPFRGLFDCGYPPPLLPFRFVLGLFRPPSLPRIPGGTRCSARFRIRHPASTRRRSWRRAPTSSATWSSGRTRAYGFSVLFAPTSTGSASGTAPTPRTVP